MHGKGLQLGLNFADITSELFAGLEKGADSLRVLKDYRKLHERITADVKAELPQVDIPAARSTSRKKPVTTDRTSTLNLYCPPKWRSLLKPNTELTLRPPANLEISYATRPNN